MSTNAELDAELDRIRTRANAHVDEFLARMRELTAELWRENDRPAAERDDR